MVHPDGSVEVLAPTAPLIGVFDDTHHLFRQDVATVSAGSLFVATSDGVTEARSKAGELFGMARFIDVIRANRHDDLTIIVDRVIQEAQAFSVGRVRDDIAVVAARFL